jgi:hypothetical protein
MGKQKTYSNFKYNDLEQLNLTLKFRPLFENIDLVQPSEWLKQSFLLTVLAPLATEKAKSELIVVPLLNEMKLKNPKTFNFFSGYNFDVDKEKGLKGHCDFLLSSNYDSPVITSPIFAIVEAKRDDFDLGIPQCVAEMYAAKIFNERNKNPQKIIYGAVTIGYSWLFLKLEENIVFQDTKNYSTNNLPELLGVLQKIIDFYKK